MLPNPLNQPLYDAFIAQVKAKGVPIDFIGELWIASLVDTAFVAQQCQRFVNEISNAPAESVSNKERLAILNTAARAQSQFRRALKDFSGWLDQADPSAPARSKTARRSKAQDAPGPAETVPSAPSDVSASSERSGPSSKPAPPDPSEASDSIAATPDLPVPLPDARPGAVPFQKPRRHGPHPFRKFM